MVLRHFYSYDLNFDHDYRFRESRALDQGVPSLPDYSGSRAASEKMVMRRIQWR